MVQTIQTIAPQYDFPIVHAWHKRDGPRRASCRNNGIRHASGDYLVFIDADFFVMPGAVRAHVKQARSGYFVAGRCKYLTEEQTGRVFDSSVTGEIMETLYGELPERSVIREHREFIRYALLRRLGIAGNRRQTFGGHFSAFRKDIEYINGYDENFVGWGGEDQDLALRMNKAGFRGRSAILTSRMLHLWHPKELGAKHWQEGPNIEYFNRKKIPFRCENGLINCQRDSL